jgi:Zn-dependent protease with chaperone function
VISRNSRSRTTSPSSEDSAEPTRVTANTQNVSTEGGSIPDELSGNSNHALSALKTPSTDVSNYNPQTDHHVLNEHSIVKDADKPNNTKPTSSAVFHSLGAGMVLAWGTNLLLTSTALIMSTAKFLNSDATWSVGFALCCSSLYVLASLADRFIPSEKYEELEQSPTGSSSEERERVRKIIEKLDPDGKFAHIAVIETETGCFGLIDRFGGKDILILNPRFSRQLNERELTNIIAHELAHANRLYTGMNDLGYLMMKLAASATFFSTFASTYNGVSSGGLISGTFAAVSGSIALGVLYAFAVQVGSSLLSNMSSRANEIRTDIRAVEMTQDVGGYLRAMAKVCSEVDKELPERTKKVVKKLQPISTHPSVEMRQGYVSRATEVKR